MGAKILTQFLRRAQPSHGPRGVVTLLLKLGRASGDPRDCLVFPCGLVRLSHSSLRGSSVLPLGFLCHFPVFFLWAWTLTSFHSTSPHPVSLCAAQGLR